jgi:murein DD-endopeptidase MepM/ murein hydrolase activator NlpD
MTPPGALSPTAALAAAGVLVVVGAAGVVARDVGGGGSEAGMASGIEAAAPQPLGRPADVPASAARPSARWRWPLRDRAPVVRAFTAPASAWGRGHRGLDLTTATGAAVLAVEAGRVTHAGVIAGRGTVSVEHRDGLVSTYEPVRATVWVGDVLDVGDVLGIVQPGAAASHCGRRACLHLGARRGTAYVDPWPLLARGELALLPLR